MKEVLLSWLLSDNAEPSFNEKAYGLPIILKFQKSIHYQQTKILSDTVQAL